MSKTTQFVRLGSVIPAPVKSCSKHISPGSQVSFERFCAFEKPVSNRSG